MLIVPFLVLRDGPPSILQEPRPLRSLAYLENIDCQRTFTTSPYSPCATAAVVYRNTCTQCLCIGNLNICVRCYYQLFCDQDAEAYLTQVKLQETALNSSSVSKDIRVFMSRREDEICLPVDTFGVIMSWVFKNKTKQNKSCMKNTVNVEHRFRIVLGKSCVSCSITKLGSESHCVKSLICTGF